MSRTSLSPGVDILKTDPRITFRGALDSLYADILEAQVIMADKGENYLLSALDEILSLVREIMSAEVSGNPVTTERLFGLTLDEIREQTHNTQKYFGFAHRLPVFGMGASAIRLNTLRAKVREVELLAEKTFTAEIGSEREDIYRALNRLSSAFYWLFCKIQ